MKAELAERISHVEELEKRLKEKEIGLMEATRTVNEKADALSKALAILEERVQREEAEKAARLVLSAPVKRSREDETTYSAPEPDGASESLTVDGKLWTRSWDPESSQHYWYCEEDDVSQWENPQDSSPEDTYESMTALTDVSADPYESADDMSLYSEYNEDDDWQEFWDEAAQSKYWYNNATVEYLEEQQLFKIYVINLGGGHLGQARVDWEVAVIAFIEHQVGGAYGSCGQGR